MTREDMSKDAYHALIKSILAILLKKGIKATTMDSIASSLQISKRTLYEIFSSKTEMVTCALEDMRDRHSRKITEVFMNSANVMEALLRSFLLQRDIMQGVNVSFLRDLDSHFVECGQDPDSSKIPFLENYVSVLQKGADEGFFRKDVNFSLLCRLQWIQMESLKRMEEFFPPDISLLEAYDSIFISFMRSIATPKGMEILDKALRDIDVVSRKNDK